MVSAERRAVVRLRPDPAREPHRAARRRRRAAARRRTRGRLHAGPRGGDRGRCPLRRFPGAGPARHEPDGHRHVGDRVLAGRRAQRQPAQAAGGGAGPPEPPARRAAHVAPDLPDPRSRRAAAVRLLRARRADARLDPAADRRSRCWARWRSAAWACSPRRGRAPSKGCRAS